ERPGGVEVAAGPVAADRDRGEQPEPESDRDDDDVGGLARAADPDDRERSHAYDDERADGLGNQLPDVHGPSSSELSDRRRIIPTGHGPPGAGSSPARRGRARRRARG